MRHNRDLISKRLARLAPREHKTSEKSGNKRQADSIFAVRVFHRTVLRAGHANLDRNGMTAMGSLNNDQLPAIARSSAD
jgi:hypothetical protein